MWFLENKCIHNVSLCGVHFFEHDAGQEVTIIETWKHSSFSRYWKMMIWPECGFNKTEQHAIQPVKDFNNCMTHFQVVFFFRFLDQNWPSTSCDSTLLHISLLVIRNQSSISTSPQPRVHLKEKIQSCINAIFAEWSRIIRQEGAYVYAKLGSPFATMCHSIHVSIKKTTNKRLKYVFSINLNPINNFKYHEHAKCLDHCWTSTMVHSVQLLTIGKTNMSSNVHFYKISVLSHTVVEITILNTLHLNKLLTHSTFMYTTEMYRSLLDAENDVMSSYWRSQKRYSPAMCAFIIWVNKIE